MGVKSINKTIILLFIFVLCSTQVLAQVVTEDTSLINNLNERLERNKAEIIKAINDANSKSMNATSQYIDDNFKIIDTRIQDFFKQSKRDMAIVVVCGFIAAFALSQVIRLGIEKRSRSKLLKRTTELEANLTRMEKEASEMADKVKRLKILDEQYSKDLKGLTRKEPFISLKMLLFGFITLIVGVLIAIVTKVGLK
jgi:hypothetical protein